MFLNLPLKLSTLCRQLGAVAKWPFLSLRGPNGAAAIRHFLLKRTDSHRKCRLSGGIFFGMTGVVCILQQSLLLHK